MSSPPDFLSASPRGDGPPHVRLNSGTQDAFAHSDAQQRPSTASRQPSSRSLTQPSRPGTAPAPREPGLRHPTSTPSLYRNAGVAESAELLLPPKKSRAKPFRDESPMRSPSAMSNASRRTSWSSDASRDSRYGPFASPFDDSRAPSRNGSDEDLNTQTVSEKYNILPSAGLLLFPEDVEKDDWLHNPDPNEKEKRDCDIWTRRGAVNVGSLVILSLGLLALFIGYPVAYVACPLEFTIANPAQHLRRQADRTHGHALHRQPLVHRRERERTAYEEYSHRPNRP